MKTNRIYVLSTAFLCLVAALSAGVHHHLVKAEEQNANVGDIIEAEHCVTYADGNKYDWFENDTSLRTLSGDNWVSGGKIANGASGLSVAGVGANLKATLNVNA